MATQGDGAGRGSEVNRRLLSSSVWTITAYAATSVAAFVISVLIGRLFGPATFGEYSFHLSVVRVSSALLALGIPAALIRSVAESEGAGRTGEMRSLYRHGVRIHLLLLPVVVLGGGWLLWLRDGHALPVIVTVVSVCAFLIIQDLEAVLKSLRRWRFISLLAAASGGGQIVLAVAASILGLRWEWYLATLLTTTTVTGWFMWRHVSAALPAAGGHPLEPSGRRDFRRLAAYLALAATVDAVLWGRPEIFFLDALRSDADVGLYATGLRLASPAAVLPLVAAQSLVPEFAGLRGADDQSRLREAYWTTSRMLVVFSVPLAFVAAPLAGDLVALFYGSEFSGASTATAILFLGSVVNGVAATTSAAVMTGPKPQIIAQLGVVASVINLALDYWLIRWWGVEGAAVANVAVQVGSVTVGAYYIRTRLSLPYPVGTLLRAGLVGLVAAGATALAAGLLPTVPGMLVGAVSGLTIYAAGVQRLGLVSWRALLRPS